MHKTCLKRARNGKMKNGSKKKKTSINRDRILNFNGQLWNIKNLYT